MDDVLARLEPELVERMSDRELAELLAALWADVELRTALHGSRAFIRERLLFFGLRGYFTARERQGIVRTLFAGAVPVRQRMAGVRRRRGQAEGSR
jgi:hypothetical protein